MAVFKCFLYLYLVLGFLHEVRGFAVDASAKKCGEDHFPCDDGDCVEKSRWCDYKADCSDDSDETFCAKVSFGFFSSGDPNGCRADHFRCLDGPCIPEGGRCDGIPSCDDFSDEEDCEVVLNVATKTNSATREAISYTTKSISTESSVTVKSEDIHHLEPETVKSASDIHHLEPETVESALDIHHLEPETVESALDIHHLEPETVKSALDIHHLEPETGKSVSDIHRLEPETEKSVSDIHHLESETVKSALDIHHLEPETVKSASDINLQLDTVKSTEDSHHIQPETYERKINILKPLVEITEPKNDILDSVEPKIEAGEPRIEIVKPFEPRNSILKSLEPRSAIKLKELTEISEELTFLKRQLKLLNRTLQESKLESPVQITSLQIQQTQSALDTSLSKTLLESGQNAQRWLLEQRHADWGWDEETARVIVALRLSNPQFFAENTKDAQLMTKELQLQLATDLLKNQSQVMSLCQLSLYVNALLATCINPRNFHGMDLIETLRQRTDNYLRAEEFVSPVVYLTLCLVEETSVKDVNKLQELIFTQNELLLRLDIQALALLAVACVARLQRYSITKLQNEAVNRLLYQHSNGTFGNVYTTALMVQALTAANGDNHWNRRNSLNILLEHQEENGSFGDILATYYVIPSLAGRSLLSLKEMTCPNIPDGKNGLIPLDVLKNIKKTSISVQLSLCKKNPVEVTNTLQLKVPENTTFFDVMRLAEETNQFFRFKYEDTSSGPIVFSIGGLPNDAERGIYWILQSNEGNPLLSEDASRSAYKQDIRQLIPKDGEKFVFWYKRII